MSSADSFGQNEWLVDAMYEQFKEDPQSVDKEWRDLFAQNGAPRNQEVNSAAAQPKAAASPSPAAAAKPEKAQRPAAQTAAADPQKAEKAKPSHLREPARAAAQDKAQKSEAPRLRTNPSPMETAAQSVTSGTAPLKGMFKAIAKNMEESLEIPTATTVRDMPAKLMIENRGMINEQFARTSGGKISFTHIIGYALVRAVMNHPGMNVHYELSEDGKPSTVTPEHINLGIAIDVPQKDGSRSLLVPAIKAAETMSFSEFVTEYNDIVARGRNGKLTVEDFSDVSISLTNPGGIGTRHSIPRLTKGQGAIIGVGATDYPAEYAGSSEDRLAELGIGKIVTLTSTYDHRVIQGAESGEFLRDIAHLLVDDKFWDHIFTCLTIPYTPMRWAQDVPNTGIDKNTRVMQLIQAYRSRGHLVADSNPLHWAQPGLPIPDHRDLDIESHGLTIWDLERTFNVGGFAHRETMTLREVLTTLRRAYTLKVGAEYTHIMDRDEREWLRDRLEAGQPKPSNPEQKYILQKLNAADAFENFLQTKYVGQKRFSLEGAESLIPLLDSAIDTAAGQGLDEVVIGMPHRGRLNVLFNIVGKPLEKIFDEFDGRITGGQRGGSGDVKYHLGDTGHHIQMFGDGEIDITLAANPSHLEAVDPVMVGMARAKQDIVDRGVDVHSIMPIMMHGDASFTGLGVVQETINLSHLRGYTVGGTIHVIVNNQIGFTTTPDSGRSTYYATDLAKGFDTPVFHVNGDDPEAVAWVARLATEYRHRFHKDVFIDLLSYRRRGHNEADDPSMTQPKMYELINHRQTVRERYVNDLIGRGDLSEEDAEKVAQDFHDQMESVFNEHKEEASQKTPQQQTGITDSQKLVRGLDTSVDCATLERLAATYGNPPEGFEYHKRVATVAKKRAASIEKGNIDWAWAELMAFGSLAEQGKTVRVTGEDTRRGTFTQRHAVAFDPRTGAEYNPMNAAAKAAGNGGRFMVYNSALTEYAGMGFEYGYSIGNQDAVVAWEAQFGDFANGAQTIIDQYLSSGETKWGLMSSLICLLPHGYEGQGPDHSSARIERFLQLSAEGSMTLAQPTVPANYFHLLRRQALGTMRRPLIVFSPKSMLRAKAAVSQPEEFTDIKTFHSVLDDPTMFDRNHSQVGNPSKVKTILLCSGKVYYELAAQRDKLGRDDVAIVRVEMLYPIPFNRISDAFHNYPNATEVRWVQEEPANQGPWSFYHEQLPELIPDMPPMKRVSRRAQAATATGTAKVHQVEEKQLIDEAFAD